MEHEIVDVTTGTVIAQTAVIPDGYVRVHPFAEAWEDRGLVPLAKARVHLVYVRQVA